MYIGLVKCGVKNKMMDLFFIFIVYMNFYFIHIFSSINFINARCIFFYFQLIIVP